MGLLEGRRFGQASRGSRRISTAAVSDYRYSAVAAVTGICGRLSSGFEAAAAFLQCLLKC